MASLEQKDEVREAKRRKKDQEVKAKAEAAQERVAEAKRLAAAVSLNATPVPAASLSSGRTPVARTPGRIPEPRDQVPEPCFDVVKAGAVVDRLKLPAAKQSFTFGRALDQVDFGVQHESCSRQHAAVTRQDGHLFITDLGSQHGTTVDGRKLVKNVPIRLSSGNNVKLGASTRSFIFREPRFDATAMMMAHNARMQAQPQGNGKGEGKGDSTRFRYRSTRMSSDFSDL